MKTKSDIIHWLYSLEDTFVSGKWNGLWQTNPHLERCWEIKECDKKRCPAYGRNEVRCWQVAGTFCEHTADCEDHAAKWKDCRECEVFAKSTPNEEARIGELLNNVLFSIQASDPNVLVKRRLIRRHLSAFKENFKLTTREAEVLSLSLDGLSRKQMAKTLDLAEETIKMHLKRLYRKVNVASREAMFTRLVRYAKQREARLN